jgi:ribosome-associated protein
MMVATEQLAIELAREASDNKCEDVTVMDLRGRSPVTDFFVVCSGTSDRQMRSAADAVKAHAKKIGVPPYGVSGVRSPNWILVDFVDVVVHVFSPDQRKYYDLELLWGDAPRLEWARSASA